MYQLNDIERTIDYSRYAEAELVEMFGRIDPRYAPGECARLASRLTELGYLVTPGDFGPGYAQPSPAKLRELIGSEHPFECAVEFGKKAGVSSYLQSTHNDFNLTGVGKIWTNGIYVCLSGAVRSRMSLIPEPPPQPIALPNRCIVNVESQQRLVRFEYRTDEGQPGAITLQLPDEAAVAALVTVLPKTRAPTFRPQIKANTEFGARLLARSRLTPATRGLIAVNSLVFIAMVLDGEQRHRPQGLLQVDWGANFGPYTTAGQWWRLLTAAFIHFDLMHILSNMVALALFGPLAERLFGTTRFLLLYLSAGVLSSLFGLYWHPMLNSAGASGAIFGILAAVLAVLLRGRDGIPADLLRSIQNSTLVVIAWSLYAGIQHPRIDSAGHVGGLVAGFILGLIVAPTFAATRAEA